LFNQFHSIDKILQAGQVLCWAAKFVGSKEVKFARHDEPHFLTAIHAMLDEADAVITYNGKSFDVPHLNREFLRNGMAPPSPFKHVDLFLTVKKQFNFPSNKLAYVAKELGIGEKTEHEGFPLWIKCAAGDKNAWAKMRKYNLQDVILTEKLYHKLLPWVSGLPNRALYGSSNNPVCPVCGSTHIQQRGYYRTNTQMYKRFQCQSCKAWGRSRFTEVAKEQRTSILTQAASS
jgi:DNA polymerase III epsilon subunit-like protein